MAHDPHIQLVVTLRCQEMLVHLQHNGFVKIAILAAFAGIVSPGVSQTTFDFESNFPLANSIVSGDTSRFAVTTEQAHGGTKSLKFADTTLEPYENWTYDLPFDLTSGTVTVWFYDARGLSAVVPHHLVAAARWGGAIILEDKNNPADFGAVEIAELPYPNPPVAKYYASEGSVDRGTGNVGDKFDGTYLPTRAVGHHRVDFHVTAAETKIYIDGVMAQEVRGPGSTGDNLRLRFMQDSPSNGGRAEHTWFDGPEEVSRGKQADWIYYDDITITEEISNPQSHHLDFEINGEMPDYDTAGEFLGPEQPPILPFDNPQMNGFVNQWAAVTTATAAHSGQNAARFVNLPAPYKSVAFDLAGASAGTSVTLWFFDANGAVGSYDDSAVNSIIIEEGATPGNFHAIEIATLPFPHNQTPRYYLTKGSASNGGSGSIYSSAFGTRSVGWHKVEIGLYNTHTEFMVDGTVARYLGSSGSTGEIAQGPGLDKAPKLRVMGDSATAGGLGNYTTANLLYDSSFSTREPVFFFDDITIPVTSAAVSDWMNY